MKFARIRFHKDYGPESLFWRAKFVLSTVHELKLHGEHANERMKNRKIPPELIQDMKDFDCRTWDLILVEVRNDTGKFISTTWERIINDKRYWVVVGFNDTVQTIIIKETSGMNGIVKEGPIYDFVKTLNQRLMDEEFQKQETDVLDRDSQPIDNVLTK